MKIIGSMLLLFFSFSLMAKPADTDTSLMILNGPWKFQLGDNPRWADPDFDDGSWETVSLQAKAGAHDDDVGLKRYVPGWAERGHAGYSGYAWYRIRIPSNFTATQMLAGPPAVDDVYQVYWNGRLLGNIGDFSERVPVIYSIQPRQFKIPPSWGASSTGKQAVLAFRVWLSPLTLSQAPDAGGIHIAPVLGSVASVNAIYQKQWSQTFWGYVVDAIEPILFLGLALLAALCIRRGAEPAFYLWLIVALLLTALVRASQVFYYWGQWESLRVYILTKIVLFIPLSLAAWVITWKIWFGFTGSRWVYGLVAISSGLYILSQFCSLVWQYEGFHPSSHVFNLISNGLRLLFLALLAFVVFRGLKSWGFKAWYSVVMIIILASGLFAQELSAIHVPGIWFPFGVGVSRTQFAYAAFCILLLIILVGRLRLLKKPEAKS